MAIIDLIALTAMLFVYACYKFGKLMAQIFLKIVQGIAIATML